MVAGDGIRYHPGWKPFHPGREPSGGGRRGSGVAGSAREERVARIPIEMAKLGYDMEAGRIASALASGTLVEIGYEAGAEVPVAEVIGYLEDGGQAR